MRPALFNSLNNFISGWYLPQSLCQEIVDELQGDKAELYSNEWENTHKGYRLIYLENLSNDLSERYLGELGKIKHLYLQQYPFLNSITPTELYTRRNGRPDVRLQTYSPNNFYSRLHCENYGKGSPMSIALVFMTYLNNIEEGGGTEFPLQQFTSKAEQGLTLMWPAYWTHPHVGVRTDEVKHIITGWYSHIV